jgi:general stress protein YciG
MTLITVDTAKIGRHGGQNSRANMSQEEAANLGRKAAEARWGAYYKAHPEKLKDKLEREGARRRAAKKRGK